MFARGRDRPAARQGRARKVVEAAFEAYLETIPASKKYDRDLFYDVRDVVGKSGFGIGSAGLPAYNVLVEGYSQSLDNDVVLSMKQANVPAVSRFVDTASVDELLRPRGAPHRGQPAGAPGAHRPAARLHQPRRRRVRRRRGLALRVRPGLGRDQRAGRHGARGAGPRAAPPRRCTAPRTRTATRTWSTFQTEEAIAAVVEGRRKEFVADLTDFAIDYADDGPPGPRAVRRRLPRGPDRRGQLRLTGGGLSAAGGRRRWAAR